MATKKNQGISGGAIASSVAEKYAMERYATVAAMFKTLGDPTRLRIVDFLRFRGRLAQSESIAATGAEKNDATASAASEVTVSDVCLYITGGAKAFSSTVFHHLKELRQAGLVTIERDGKKKRCALNPEAVTALSIYLGGTLSVPESAAKVETSEMAETAEMVEMVATTEEAAIQPEAVLVTPNAEPVEPVTEAAPEAVPAEAVVEPARPKKTTKKSRKTAE